MNKTLIIVLVIIFILLASFGVWYFNKNKNKLPTPNNQKQDSSQAINLDSSNNNQTIDVGIDDVIDVTLNNPSDGGYEFNDPEYDKTILKMLSHEHTAPNSQLLGDFGEDKWSFQAIKTGKTDLIFYISRSWENQKEVDFQITLNVN